MGTAIVPGLELRNVCDNLTKCFCGLCNLTASMRKLLVYV